MSAQQSGNTKQFDAIVIGAGPGGYPCAIRLAQLGKKTAIVEKEYWGGVCLNVGCIPSKALIHAAKHYYSSKHTDSEMGISASDVKVDMGKMVDWKSGVVKKLTGGVSQLLKANGIESFKGTATFKDAKTLEIKSSDGTQTISAPAIVIATGSRIIEIPSLPFNGKNVLNSTDGLELKTLPKRMIVIGGGYIGMELGMVYAKLGTQVTIVEAMDRILATVDKELTAVVEKKMKKLGMTSYVSAKALGLKEKDPAKADVLHLEIETADKAKQTLEAEVVLVSVGRKPNSDGLGLDKIGVKIDARGNIDTNRQGMTNVPGVYAIGDVTGPPQLAHRATMDGLLIAAVIAGEKAYKDYKTVPWAIFCDPEIASAGLSEKEAQDRGHKIKVGKFPFVASGRALSTNETDGMVKVVIDEKTQAVLGVHIVGPDASTMIAEATLAIEMGALAEDVVRTIHTHPTLPEAFMESVEAALGHPVHIFKPAERTAHARRPESMA